MAGKYVPGEDTEALIAAGVTVMGENRLQDLQAKAERAQGRLTFDFIGHLQRRKVRDVLALTRLVHSVNSARLAAEIDRRSEGPMRVLVEVNVAEETEQRWYRAALDFGRSSKRSRRGPTS